MLRKAKELAYSSEPIGRRDPWEIYDRSNSTVNLIARKDGTPYFTPSLHFTYGETETQ